MNPLTAVDLFCGAGGLGVGLGRAGFHIVLANEIEPDFAATYRANHADCRLIVEDIAKIDFRARLAELGLSRIDLVAGGPPCQGFSTVGSKRIDDPRNSLFHQFLRTIEEILPGYVLFENVSGFMKLYDGVMFETLKRELGSLGYDTASGILEAADFGLPQRRKRTIVIGWRRGTAPVRLPEPTHCEGADLFGRLPYLPIMDAISDLPPIATDGQADEYLCAPKNDYQRRLRNGCSRLTEHNCSKYGEKMREILELIPPGGSVMDLPERLRPASFFKNTYARLVPNQPSPTITRNFGTPSSSRCVHPFQNRALSTREGARLQGFPDDYLFAGTKISKNLQIGNAVPPIFGEIIAREIVKSISAI